MSARGIQDRGGNKATSARRLALEVTTQVRERNAFARELIESKVRHAKLPAEERNFAMLLILGVVATSGELDFFIDQAVRQARVRPKMRDALRISAYELIFLHKPAHVVVSQGVELARSITAHATGFANRVLHEIAQLKEKFPFGNPATEAQALAHQQAFPLWLASRLIDDLGFAQAALFMEASNQQAPLFFADLKNNKILEATSARLKDYLLPIEKGELLVVDASAQEVALLATPSVEQPFLEVGSGRGTKTVLIMHHAKRIHGIKPQLYALDLHAYKHDILKQRIEMHSLNTVTPVVGDATQLAALAKTGKLPSQFAGILIDAPCSGTGTLRRHPEIRWRLTPQAVSALAAQGLAMLSSAAQHTQPGGFVVYSTCSALKEENEQVIEQFLASEAGKGFALEGEPFCSSLAPGSPDAHFAVKLIRQG